MSTRNARKFGDGNDLQSSVPSDEDPVPQSLKEVLDLMNSINRRLEDCSVEWQSAVSKKQWRILNAKSEPQKSWEQSLLARTYFTDRNLDEGFQNLLTHVRTFMENMNNFIALLRGERKSSRGALETTSVPEVASSSEPAGKQSSSPHVTKLDLSSLDKSPQRAVQRRGKRLAHNLNSNVQQCFADLIKAKIDLDTKFLGFEAVLNGSPHALPRSTDNATCLCQICSNVLEAVIDNEKILRDVITQSKVKRVNKASKRLPQSARAWKRDQGKKQSVSLGHIAAQSLLSPKDLNDS